MADIVSTQTPKARKAHKCDWCGGKIEVGERYERTFITDYGDAWTWKCHPECQRLVQIFIDMDYIEREDLVSRDSFREACQEYCRAHICPGCESWDKERNRCRNDQGYCLEKIKEMLLEGENDE